jgi:pyridoxal phosphate enzyme (YggS family)
VSHIEQNLQEIQHRIRVACHRAGRNADEVTLIAVSKNFPVEDIRIAWEAGQRHFGENRWQEAETKIPLLPSSLQWHCIGSLQRNKVRKVLPHFCLIHSIDTLRLAAYANEVAKEEGLYPAVLLQVNLAGELTKGGFSLEDLEREAEALFALDRLEIQGLMTVPPPVEQPEQARAWFSGMRQLRDTFSQHYSVPMPVLSMGMSGDFEVAIEEGATHVRVGSAIFGHRPSQH